MIREDEHLVARIPRPDGGELHVIRRLRKGEPSTRLERFSLDRETGELVPTPRQSITIRDDALPQVLAALQRIATKVLASTARAPASNRRIPQRAVRTGDLTTNDRRKEMDVF